MGDDRRQAQREQATDNEALGQRAVDWGRIESVIQKVESGDADFFYRSRMFYYGMRAYHWGVKPVAAALNTGRGYFAGAFLGAAKGSATGTPHGVLAGAVASLAKDVGADIALELLTSYLRTPQAIAGDLGNRVMAEALDAWDENFVVAGRIYRGEDLSRAEKLEFVENHVAALLFGAGRELWQESRAEVESGRGGDYADLLSAVASSLSESALVSEAFLAAEVLALLRESDEAVEEYPPLVEFLARERRERTGAGLAVHESEAPVGEDVFFAIASDGQEGRWRTISFPVPSGGPSISVSANRTSVRGGSSLVTVSSRTPMTRLFVAHHSRSLDGHFELPVSGTEVDLQLDFSQSLPEEFLELRYAAADGSGAVGSPVRHSFDVVRVGTGSLQITVSWNTRADVDLHVVEPGGEEIFWGNGVSEAGGDLDLDANAECGRDDTRNENVVWEVPPRGRYVVRVHYYSSCGVGSTDYVVRVNKAGDDDVFRGRFRGRGERGGRGAGVDVAVVNWP